MMATQRARMTTDRSHALLPRPRPRPALDPAAGATAPPHTISGSRSLKSSTVSWSEYPRLSSPLSSQYRSSLVL